MAPMTEERKVPQVPVGTHPNSETSQPPRMPPTRPTIRLTSNPEPLPLKIRLAIHPAARPMSKYHKKYICFLILVDNQDNTNSVPGRMNGPEIIRGMR